MNNGLKHILIWTFIAGLIAIALTCLIYGCDAQAGLQNKDLVDVAVKARDVRIDGGGLVVIFGLGTVALILRRQRDTAFRSIRDKGTKEVRDAYKNRTRKNWFVHLLNLLAERRIDHINKEKSS